MIQIIYTVPYVAEDAKTYSYRAPMPIRRACPVVGPPFLSAETDAWNCNLCGADMPFFNPFLTGDIIPFQTNFADNYNTTPDVLTAGIKDSLSADWYVVIELQDGTGTAISDDADSFCSAYYVSHTEMNGSFQTWFVNTGLFPVELDCWRLKITYLKINQITLAIETERVLYTEYYKKGSDCSSYIALQSVYNGIDCVNGNYTLFENSLGVGTTETYYNFLRLEGEVEFYSRSEEVITQTDKNKVIRKNLTKLYRTSKSLVAPYYALMLHRLVGGSTVTVGGTTYKNFTFQKDNESSRMWVIQLQFEEDCTVDTRGCNL